MANQNAIIFTFCIIAFFISLMAFKNRTSTEGFTPRFMRKQKNKMYRMIRRAVKPYNDDVFDQLNKFRRKWL